MNDAFIVTATQLACLLEVSAPKPGNVSPGLHFHDARYEDFLASAVAIGPALAAGGPLGATIRDAIDATSRWTRSNTNLGLVLLLAPLARAARAEGNLRDAVRAVLADTTVDDAREVYAAIRRARPGGLGTVNDEDVAAEPRVTLLEAMRLAADRDGIAREYVTGFRATFDVGAPALARARADGLVWEDTTVEAYLNLLAHAPDTHIVRRHGAPAAEAVSAAARAVIATGSTRTADGRRAIAELDRRLRADHMNPGTTADLTAASLFVALLGGAWSRTNEY
jgi:triphosphoribosyl-dephospho-CoA synthase